MEHCGHERGSDGLEIAHGLLNGLLIAIPLSAIFWIAVVLILQDGPIGETTSLALMIAAVCETILARPHLLAVWMKLWHAGVFDVGIRKRDAGSRAANAGRRLLVYPDSPRGSLERQAGKRIASIEELLRYVETKATPAPQSRFAHATHSLFRQAAALSALVGTYLQYYFLEVNLQIASLHALTVFVPVTSMT